MGVCEASGVCVCAVCLGCLRAGCGVCLLFCVCPDLCRVHVWLFGVSQWLRASVWQALGALCLGEGAGPGLQAGRRRALRAVSVWAGAARIAGFPGRVPRAGGGHRRRLPAQSRPGNRSPLLHEILIRPSRGPDQIGPGEQGARGGGGDGVGVGGVAALSVVLPRPWRGRQLSG